MKKKYEREAWILDDGILLKGVKDKYGFHPHTKDCGWDMQIITKRMVGKVLFYDLDEAIRICGNIEIVEE